ncbi:MAG: EAL domain-containing protein [Candidatus Scalindua sp.]|nr:EAL domain-containing protein [Candidatus Scalindua sp.]
MNYLKLATDKYEILDHSPIGQFVLRKDYIVVFWNRCLETWTGISRDKIVGTKLTNHFPHLGEKKYTVRINSIFNSGPPIILSSQLHKHFIPSPLPGGKFRIHSTYITGVPALEDGELYAFVAMHDETSVTSALESNKDALKQLEEEVEVRKKAEEQLVQLARYDLVTGLANRALFRETLLKAIARVKRNNSKFTLMFLDLDHFKDVNDTMGHDAGDKLLISVAERLKERVRENDLVARLGGDEFAIFIDDCGPDDAARIAKSILDILAPSHKLGNNEVFVSSSIGIVICPEGGEDPESICKSADTAMYHAKKMGRNNYQFFSPELYLQAVERIHLESDMRRAIKQDDFMLFYQPQMDMEENVIGLEALIRWEHHELGIISPSRFIPVAERTGIIISISEWVLFTACMMIREWQKKFGTSCVIPTVAVNISPRELKQESFLSTIKNTLSVTGVDPRYIEIELTESSIMEDPKKTITLLEKIHNLGIRISVDDFGTGYSSLNYLKRLPIDSIKIDMSFVQGIGNDHNDEEIIKVIIALAHNLGLQAIAEGVETEEHVHFLREHKCDHMQGYYYSRPLSAEIATQFLADILPGSKAKRAQCLNA